MGEEVLRETNLHSVRLLRRGKVRDIYDLGDRLLLVTTDRLSAFDVVLPSGLPGKGKILTALSVFWFGFTRDIVGNHLLPEDLSFLSAEEREVVEGRAMLVKKAEPVLVECVVRGYLSGSAWREYQANGQVCGIRLPQGLRESEKLPEPIFTPTTKAQAGHDQPLTFEELQSLVGSELASRLRELSLRIYEKASLYAGERGIIIADTKFEFGFHGGELMLIDELLTPDSSRFWLRETYRPGRSQPSLDKQPVRDWLENSGWDKSPPAPELPPEVVEETARRYQEVCQRLVPAK
ncbi:MAG: phosphoribosylaminoimidazolesuccinocarboxamide synthase [Chloroflexi bacterium]|nr:MAG: phosphoribosylaminoimidazolesuccinocarboxamide synthase [Chloroflexota bacterium]